MTLTVEATYENGTLKLMKPLPLKEHEQVRITIEPKSNVVQESYGLIGFKGTHEELEHLLAEAEEFEDLP